MLFPRVLLSAAILAAGFSGGNLAADEPELTASVKKLLQERLAVFAELEQLVNLEYSVGRGTVEQVNEAKSATLNAKLDLCETKQQRIGVHEEIVTLEERRFQIVEQMLKNQDLGPVDGLKAKARLLKARIELERAKAAK